MNETRNRVWDAEWCQPYTLWSRFWFFSDLLSTVLLTMRVIKGQSLGGREGMKPRPLPYSNATGMWQNEEVSKQGCKYCGSLSSLMFNKIIHAVFIKCCALSLCHLQSILRICKNILIPYVCQDLELVVGHRLIAIQRMSIFQPHWGFSVTAWVMHDSKFEMLCGCEACPFLLTLSLTGASSESEADLSIFASNKSALEVSIFWKMACRNDAGAVSEWA